MSTLDWIGTDCMRLDTPLARLTLLWAAASVAIGLCVYVAAPAYASVTLMLCCLVYPYVVFQAFNREFLKRNPWARDRRRHFEQEETRQDDDYL